jgi:hypothetical protein
VTDGIYEVASRSAIAQATVRVDGTFELPEVHKGDYVLVAGYADSTIVGFWASPIKVLGAETTRVDLNDENLSYIEALPARTP